MKKFKAQNSFSLLSVLAIAFLTAGATLSGCTKKDSQVKVVTITQIIEHGALDDERQGFLEALKEGGYEDGKNLKVHYQNSQGNMAIAMQIARKFASLRPDLAVGISTPSSQALLSALEGSSVPMLFSAVSDPIAANLVSQKGESTAHVTGVTDYLAPAAQLELVRKFVPNLKKLGFLYNPGEVNSVVALKEMKIQAESLNIVIIPSPANTTGEVPAAATSLVGKVEAIYLPTDNTAVAAIQSIVQVGIQNHLPVFAADMGSVQKGAIAMVGYDRVELGRILGRMALKVLKGESTQEIPVAKNHPTRIGINKKSAEQMGVALPADLGADTIYVNEGK